MKPGTCLHFNGLSTKTCGAGIDYRNSKDSEGRLHCLAGKASGCPKYLEPTQADLDAWEEETNRLIAESTARFKKLEPLLERIKRKYQGRDMNGTASCPICGGVKTLSVVHSGRNGHLSVFCTTENCIRMRE